MILAIGTLNGLGEKAKLAATAAVTKVWRLILSIPGLGKANFVAKMGKNISKADKGTFKAFDKINLKNGAALDKSSKGELYLGIMPDANTLTSLAKKAQTGDKKSEIAVLSAVEDFELMGYEIARKQGRPYITVNKGELQALTNGNAKQIVVKDYGSVPVKELEEGAKFIDEQIRAGRVVYTHCKSGKGRSASLVMAYLMKYQRLSFDEALATLKASRPDISLLATQLESLRLYSKTLPL